MRVPKFSDRLALAGRAGDRDGLGTGMDGLGTGMRVPGFSDRLALGLAYLTIRADPLLATLR